MANMKILSFPLVVLSVLLLSANSVQCSTWFQKFDSLAAQISNLHVRGIAKSWAPRKSSGSSVSPAPNCDTLECPPYKLVHEETDFEVRRYRNTTWVLTEPIDDVSFNKATYRGFHSLFEYIEGENKNSTHVPMTAPVVTAIVPSAGPFCSSAFVVSLYVPSKYAQSPPQPKTSLDPGLKVVKAGPICVAVRKFGGFATDFNVANEAAALADTLKGTSWESVTGKDGNKGYAIAQYNSPFEFARRVNEVWVKIPVGEKGSEDCLPEKKAPSPRAASAVKDDEDMVLAEA